MAQGWDWAADLAPDFARCARLARETGVRLSMHPGQYTVLNTPDSGALERSVAGLAYHAQVLDLLELGEESGLVLHIGGGYSDKQAAARRFVTAFAALPKGVASRLWLENDDVTWDTAEVLALAQEVGRPMVFDLHHHRVLREDDWLPWLERILPTWGRVRPKLHFSSPQGGQRSRHHADWIDPDDFAAFARRVEGRNLDVMLECKQKDLAVLRLRQYFTMDDGPGQE